MFSCGVDITEIKRFSKLIQNKDFLNKYFTQKELSYINGKTNKLETIAGIFASKEAFLKSINKGINEYDLKSIEILHNELGAPYLNIHKDIKKDIDLRDTSLSISHDGNYAIAFVIVYKLPS